MLLEDLDEEYEYLKSKGIDAADTAAKVRPAGERWSNILERKFPKRTAFLEYIDNLDDNTLRKLAALMY